MRNVNTEQVHLQKLFSKAHEDGGLFEIRSLSKSDVYHIIEEFEITTLKELSKIPQERLLKVRSIGPTKADTILNELKLRGLIADSAAYSMTVRQAAEVLNTYDFSDDNEDEEFKMAMRIALEALNYLM